MRLIILIFISLVSVVGCSTNNVTNNENATADANEQTTTGNKNQIGHNFKIYNNSRF